MQLSESQLETIGRRMLIEKMNRSFCKSLQDFAKICAVDRGTFLENCMTAARLLDFNSEQGIASYALGAWWLDIGFEQQSKYIIGILNTKLPEIRKVHAMNDWIHARLKSPADPNKADQALRDALSRTTAWGLRA